MFVFSHYCHPFYKLGTTKQELSGQPCIPTEVHPLSVGHRRKERRVKIK